MSDSEHIYPNARERECRLRTAWLYLKGKITSGRLPTGEWWTGFGYELIMVRQAYAAEAELGQHPDRGYMTFWERVIALPDNEMAMVKNTLVWTCDDDQYPEAIVDGNPDVQVVGPGGESGGAMDEDSDEESLPAFDLPSFDFPDEGSERTASGDVIDVDISVSGPSDVGPPEFEPPEFGSPEFEPPKFSMVMDDEDEDDNMVDGWNEGEVRRGSRGGIDGEDGMGGVGVAEGGDVAVDGERGQGDDGEGGGQDKRGRGEEGSEGLPPDENDFEIVYSSDGEYWPNMVDCVQCEKAHAPCWAKPKGDTCLRCYDKKSTCSHHQKGTMTPNVEYLSLLKEGQARRLPKYIPDGKVVKDVARAGPKVGPSGAVASKASSSTGDGASVGVGAKDPKGKGKAGLEIRSKDKGKKRVRPSTLGKQSHLHGVIVEALDEFCITIKAQMESSRIKF
ncbi:hypothetical protein OF83DRAFT_1087699 [Amylostereum chailletii]|nr:hypothetical protein OF83DRAFT_1087699 [Amylostereum chailletii]